MILFISIFPFFLFMSPTENHADPGDSDEYVPLIYPTPIDEEELEEEDDDVIVIEED